MMSREADRRQAPRLGPTLTVCACAAVCAFIISIVNSRESRKKGILNPYRLFACRFFHGTKSTSCSPASHISRSTRIRLARVFRVSVVTLPFNHLRTFLLHICSFPFSLRCAFSPLTLRIHSSLGPFGYRFRHFEFISFERFDFSIHISVVRFV